MFTMVRFHFFLLCASVLFNSGHCIRGGARRMKPKSSKGGEKSSVGESSTTTKTPKIKSTKTKSEYENCQDFFVDPTAPVSFLDQVSSSDETCVRVHFDMTQYKYKVTMDEDGWEEISLFDPIQEDGVDGVTLVELLDLA